MIADTVERTASGADSRDLHSVSGPSSADGARNAPSFLSLKNVNKAFGAFTALEGIDLDIQEGEFVCFLGPSGCGKSTLLRIIAGLEQQTAGTISHRDRDISGDSAAARHFGILFQSYALFPNLTVRENVAYGLHNQKLSADVIDRRVKELLQLVELTGSEQKYPRQLSGGQQQRVALARAIAPSPKLLLLDEPLSALDAKVRVYLREKIRELQKQLGLTTIMVTHDQEEALTMADRIVVMNQGRIDQVGAPIEIYKRPSTRFVANFVGKANFIGGNVSGTLIQIAQNTFPTMEGDKLSDGAIDICVRPEHIQLTSPGATSGGTLGRVEKVEFLGSFYRVAVSSDALSKTPIIIDLSAGTQNELSFQVGEAVRMIFSPQHFTYFAAEQNVERG